MKMWIQLHNHSTQELGNVNAEQAKEALAKFDWASEQGKRDEARGEACDPGLGLVAEDGSILHICPVNEEGCYVYYHHDVRKKILGFIPFTTPESHYIELCSYEIANDLIDHHFEGNAAEIVKLK